MPIVTMPDGQNVSFPDDMPREEIKGLIASRYPEVNGAGEAQPTDNMTVGKAFRASFANGVPLGRAAMAGIAGVYGGAMSEDLTIPEAYAQARQELGEERVAGKEQFPKASMAGTGAGIVGSALSLPVKALQAPTMVTRAAKAGLAAIPYGAGYAADTAETFKEGVGNAIQSIPASAAFGVAGSAATDLALRGGRMAYEATGKPLAARALQYLDKVRANKQPKINIDIQGGQTTTGVQSGVASALPDSPIPLTAGDITQDAAKQSLEVNALSGTYGDESRLIAQKTRELQASKAGEFLEKQAGAQIDTATPFDAAANITNKLSTAYKAAKAKTRAAYKDVGALQQEDPLAIGAQFIKETIVPDLQDWARKGGSGTGFDLNAKSMTEAKRLYNQAISLKDMKKITAVNFSRMEQWRGRVSQSLRDAKAALPIGVTDNSETVFLNGMLQRFDDTFNNLPVEAIRNGNDEILDALAKARAARSSQGTLFEKNKLIMEVLRNNQITNESLAHSIFTSGGNNAKDRAVNFNKIYEATGKNPEILKSFKEGIYGNIYKNSLGVEVTPSGQTMIDFAKLAKNLGRFVDENPTLFKMLHPEAQEQKVIKDALEAARRIRSKKVGVVNYSNSAYKVIELLDSISPTAAKVKIPLTDISARNVLSDLAQDAAKRDLQESVSNVLQLKLEGMNKDYYNFFERFAPQAAPSVSGKISAEQGVRE